MEFKNDPIAAEVSRRMMMLREKDVKISGGHDYNRIFEEIHRNLKEIQKTNPLVLLQRFPQYDFNCQFMNGEWNIFIEKNDVDLTSFGSFNDLSEAVEEALKYLNRINKTT